MTKKIITCVFLVALMSDSLAVESHQVLHLQSPAPANSYLSRITSDESGQVYLSWVTKRDAVASLSFSTLINGKWSAPTTISQGDNWFVNWADFPVLEVNEDSMVAHWLRRSGQDTYDYDVVASFFDSEARQWGAGQIVNTDGVKAEHGFVSMSPTGQGDTLLTWLDGRNTRDTLQPGAMTLRAAVFNGSGTNLEEWELDSSVCDCCQTSSAMTAQGPVVVYRDRTQDEIRDTSIVRFIDGSWTSPATVHADGWQVQGCPVNGPSVAATGSTVAVAWFTAKDEKPMVQMALSHDDGETFLPAVVVASSHTNGRVDTAILDSGEIVVSWVDTTESVAKLMLTRFDSMGQWQDTTEVATMSPSRRSGFPIIESVGDTVYVTWTAIGKEPQVKVARVSF